MPDLTRRILATAAAPLALAGCSQPARVDSPEASISPAPTQDTTPSSTTETTTTTEAPETTTSTVVTVILPTIPPTTLAPITVSAVAPPVTKWPLEEEDDDQWWQGQPGYDGRLPFNGWAIPEYIVMCESGGRWDAYNPSSGAAGPYQLMGFHLGGDARQFSRETQHAKAAQLWDNGRGRLHWAECL